jgi:hypothetical protein
MVDAIDLGSLPRSTRIRAVLSWNSCVDLGPNPIAVPDFDLFLHNRTRSKVHFASMSFDDNNEGFDVDLDTDEEFEDGDEWEIVVAWLPNQSESECEGSIEPIAITVAFGFPEVENLAGKSQSLSARLAQSLASKGNFATW